MSMTKEQEDSIEILKNTDISTIELAEITDLHTYSIAVRNVLSMIKEKDRQINSKSGTINALQCALKERTEERDRKDDIITKLNKQIDSMADYMLSGLDDTTFNNICKQGHCVHVLKDNRPTKCRKCKDCIKQYFERKSKEWKKI